MSEDIQVIKDAFDAVGIEYTIREEGEWNYLFIGERRDIHSMDGGEFRSFEEDSTDLLTIRHKYIEFEDGKLASYFNA